MQTKAKLEVEIAALGAEVRELARERGKALPTMEDWVDLCQALALTGDDLQTADESGESEEAVFSGFVTRAPVTPAAEPVQEALVAVVVAAVRQDRLAYFAMVRALRTPLSDLLALRAEKWAQDWNARSRFLDLYRGATSWLTGTAAPRSLPVPGDQRTAEAARDCVARAKGWEVVVLAGLALRCAAEELTAWREWVTGGAVKAHGFQQAEQVKRRPSRSCSDEPALLWAREAAKHTLPEEEEIELVSRGLASAEELAAARALSPIGTDAAGGAGEAEPEPRY